MKPLVYVAAPYSAPDPVANTNAAIQVAANLLDTGLCAPIVPHLTLLFHLVTPRPYEVWLDYDLEVLARCDALLRLPGQSSGADGEVAFALEQDIPVFTTIGGLLIWLERKHEGV